MFQILQRAGRQWRTRGWLPDRCINCELANNWPDKIPIPLGGCSFFFDQRHKGELCRPAPSQHGLQCPKMTPSALVV